MSSMTRVGVEETGRPHKWRVWLRAASGEERRLGVAPAHHNGLGSSAMPMMAMVAMFWRHLLERMSELRKQHAWVRRQSMLAQGRSSRRRPFPTFVEACGPSTRFAPMLVRLLARLAGRNIDRQSDVGAQFAVLRLSRDAETCRPRAPS